jgi:hypothetical protein
MYRMQYRSHNRYRILVSARVLLRYRIGTEYLLTYRIRTEFPSSYQKQPREELGNFSSYKVTTAVTGVDIYDVVTRTFSFRLIGGPGVLQSLLLSSSAAIP